METFTMSRKEVPRAGLVNAAPSRLGPGGRVKWDSARRRMKMKYRACKHARSSWFNRVNLSLPGVRLPPYGAALVLFGVAFAEVACAAFMPCCLAPRAWHQTQVGARLLLRGLFN